MSQSRRPGGPGSEHAGFLEAILREPDQPHHLAIYADWLEEHGDPDRAELIRIQVERETIERRGFGQVLGSDLSVWTELVKQEAAILRSHGVRFYSEIDPPSQQDGWVWSNRDIQFEAGLLRRVMVTDLERFCQRPPWRAGHPIRSLEFRATASSIDRIAGLDVRRLVRLTEIAFVTELIFHGLWLPPELLERLADSRTHFSRLQRLDLDVLIQLGGRLGTLAAGTGLASLRQLCLRGSSFRQLDPEDLLALANRLDHLENLDLIETGLGQAGFAQLLDRPRPWRHLGLRRQQLDLAEITCITQSVHLEQLRGLSLTHATLDDRAARVLAESPLLSHLQVLTLGGNRIGDEGAIALARSPYLNHLQLLDLTDNQITDRGARCLAHRESSVSLRISLVANPIAESTRKPLRRKGHPLNMLHF